MLHDVAEAKHVASAVRNGEGVAQVGADEEVAPALALPYALVIAELAGQGVAVYRGFINRIYAEGHGQLSEGVAVVVAHLNGVAVVGQ